MPFDVITMGSATVDCFARTKTKKVKIECNHGEHLIAYPAGEKLLISDLLFQVGGGGTNTAVCFSRLGLKTAFIGKVGDKLNAERVLRHLKKEKVSTDLVCGNRNSRTGYSIVLDPKGADRTILAFKGSNNELQYRELPLSKIKAKWLYFTTMLEDSFQTQQELARYAEKKGIKVAYNISSYLATKGLRSLKKLLGCVHLLVLNLEEARMLTREHALSKIYAAIQNCGPQDIIITNGPKGAYALLEGTRYQVILPKLKAIDTTGAGDSFGATYLASYIKTKDPHKSLLIATAQSQSVIGSYGAQAGLLSWNAVQKNLDPKIKVKIC